MFVRLAAYELFCVVCIPPAIDVNLAIEDEESRSYRLKIGNRAILLQSVTDRSPLFNTRTASGTVEIVM